jgi:predicted nuclease of restriction endonuclease-like RecB superfamily
LLTSDLLVADVRKGQVYPRYLPTQGPEAEPYLARAQALIDLFHGHAGLRRGELDEALADRVRGRPDFKVERGLAKLLEDRTTFRGLSWEEAADLRREVFVAAAGARAAGSFSRQAVLADVGRARGWEAAEVDAGLYADLKANEVVVGTEPISPTELLERYDLALAQAVLLRATQLSVTVRGAPPPRLRQLLRHVRFHGLLTGAEREGDEVRLALDGPMSIFEATPRYGVRMAGFLPALLLCGDFALDAKVQLGKGKRKRAFQLGPDQGLISRRRDVGAWLPELVEAFTARFAEVAEGWVVDDEVPLLNLGGEVVVPDFRFRHESGWEGWLEILGYWRKGGVARRLKVLSERDAPNLVLAVDVGLKLGKADVKGLKGPVVRYRELPNARKVLKALEDLRGKTVGARRRRSKA